MGQQAQEIINNIKLQNRAEYEKRKNEFLISNGYCYEERSPRPEASNDYPFSGYDSNTGNYYYYKHVAVDCTDEEYEEMLNLTEKSSPRENVVAKAMFVIAIVVFAVGFVAGIASGMTAPFNGTVDYEELAIMCNIFVAWFDAFVAGSIFLGLSEIIKLLHNKNNKE